MNSKLIYEICDYPKYRESFCKIAMAMDQVHQVWEEDRSLSIWMKDLTLEIKSVVIFIWGWEFFGEGDFFSGMGYPNKKPPMIVIMTSAHVCTLYDCGLSRSSCFNLYVKESSRNTISKSLRIFANRS